MAASSLPVKNSDAFTETQEGQWVNITPVVSQKSVKYRKRSGAFTKPAVAKHSSFPAMTRVTEGFMVPSFKEQEEPVQSRDGCQDCMKLQEKLVICTEFNESLLKRFSRIMQLIGKSKKLIDGFEEDIGLKNHPLDGKTNPVFIESQSVCLMSEADKEERRESGLQYTSIELTKNMFPVNDDHALTLSELSHFTHNLHQYLEECRKVSLSSANACFESRFGSLRSYATTSSSPSSAAATTRPPLQRMHTLSNTSDAGLLASFEHSMERGAGAASRLPRPLSPHCRNEQRPDDKSGSMRRTHSENELLNLQLDSRVMLMDSEDSIASSTNKEVSSQAYSRVFSTPQDTTINKESRDVLSRDAVSHDTPFRSHLMSMLRNQSALTESISSVSFKSIGGNPCEGSGAHEEHLKPLQEGLTGDESIQLLDKITTLEQHRLALLTELESMKEKNNAFWETLDELREELDEKDFQLKLLTADVRMATREMNRTNERRREAEELRLERDKLQDRLRNLEDERQAMKDSLVQLVTEKAATNKALTIENQRLRQKVKKVSHLPNQGSQPTIDVVDSDPLSAEEEFRMQGLLQELDGGDYVHKQGFLVKQGHKMKNWRKRMFVLDTHTLSYYNTQQPQGTVPLEEITKVQVSQSSKLPFMFEIHRNDRVQKNQRVYYLSAPSHDEMQSWLGIIQTLKDTKRQSLRHSQYLEYDTSPVGSPERPTSHLTANSPSSKARSFTHAAQNSLTLPVVERSSRQRQTVIETGGVRNRMFTDTGQRRTDISIGDTSDEEDTSRSPLSMSSDEEALRNDGSFKLKYSKK